jgi:hypothetical protein
VEYEENLKYFLEFGVQPGDGCDYLLVVQTVGAGMCIDACIGWWPPACLCCKLRVHPCMGLMCACIRLLCVYTRVPGRQPTHNE